MPNEPVIRKTINLPYDYRFTFQATPWTIRRTLILLVPWAIVAMLPSGKPSKTATAIASKISPFVKQVFR